jgi:hypothetical protein
MANDWKTFIVTTKYVTDLQGVEYAYQIPPSWKTELLVWEILESSPEVNATSLSSVLTAFDIISEAVTFILKLPKDNNIEDTFDGESIEQVFTEIWNCISVIPEHIVQSAKASQKTSSDEFSLSTALALFAAECGWTPEQVLSLPKVQVMCLVSSISEYVSQNMKFQAAIHGIPLEEERSDTTSSNSPESAQIDIERQMRDFMAAGLPIEVI